MTSPKVRRCGACPLTRMAIFGPSMSPRMSAVVLVEICGICGNPNEFLVEVDLDCYLARALGLAGGPYPVICSGAGSLLKLRKWRVPCGTTWSPRNRICGFKVGLFGTIHFHRCLWLCTHAHKEITCLGPSAFRSLELPSFEHWEVSVSACSSGFLPNFCLQTVLIWCLSFCLHHCGFGTSTQLFTLRDPKTVADDC